MLVQFFLNTTVKAIGISDKDVSKIKACLDL